ncbi:hypothetical protein [Nocardioides jejuensis]|uniref:Lipoprotein n=1 Tax=Nocardioides jejuensis TaxID=2502782 RepID=A0A4R1BXQ4_9ACTN|nr:hypothetical protein [Nocardioides jejuensis]TCJ22741.1 hypothetical protein EPD65_12400 [Nocardioides jejuensis]
MRSSLAGLAAAAALVLVSCGGQPSKAPHADATKTDAPSLDPGDFVAQIDNPWLPLRPGNTWVYRSTSEDGVQRNVVTVLAATRVVDGVTATGVHDVVMDSRGRIVEDTHDWFAQDTHGNVWYLGEDTSEYDPPGGKTFSKEGSWEAGVDGAVAGIAMLANPRVGDGYRMEYLAGHAEDRATVRDLDASLPAGLHLPISLRSVLPNLDNVSLLRTEDTTPLEPDLVENKWYAEGVGVVAEKTVAGGDEVVQLIRFTRG